MSFKSFYIGDVSSPLNIQIRPTFGYTETINDKHNIQTTQTGKIRRHKIEGGYYRFTVPFNLVNSSDANAIRQYWQDQTVISFTSIVDSQEYVNCLIMNKNDPFKSYTEAKFTDFDGILTLLSRNDQLTARGIQKHVFVSSITTFILDDPIFGILDKNTLG